MVKRTKASQEMVKKTQKSQVMVLENTCVTGNGFGEHMRHR